MRREMTALLERPADLDEVTRVLGELNLPPLRS